MDEKGEEGRSETFWDFLDGSVVKTPHFHRREINPWLEN